ncbi:hypothetical protein C5E07_09795 [Pseudoclavibacter sp. RFBJ3]|uniref:hypothetical protein n=1 Tax=unclassified Pseudoclavibacter TaxID=2615177 RepID=UPI000CE73FB4|nr:MULTISPECIES: hypothetical protein [unclassified Pseudoclavibacter]PPF83776.1 hypothetical protein C5C12_08875 [Pseudoclavibacter sp. RFBJ5]PPF92056.1 hypothetical protein C5E07_09795 [Pseudoclavibacter sp. RFBJ3]PPF96919.1 hypothetical protein C5C19_13105 [Pseudoclavibacter sp. RFBH5]PPG23606.1 hypothetical protein C5E13_08490 [Pseudoclavibacter sp. RFBI4]
MLDDQTTREGAANVQALAVAAASGDEAGWLAVIESLDVDELRAALMMAALAITHPHPLIALAGMQADDEPPAGDDLPADEL